MDEQPPAEGHTRCSASRGQGRGWFTAVLLMALSGSVVVVSTTGLPTLVVVGGLVFVTTASTCWPWCIELGRPSRVAAELGLVVLGLTLASWGLVLVAGPVGIAPTVALLAGSPVTLPWWRRLARSLRTDRVGSAGGDRDWGGGDGKDWTAADQACAEVQMQALSLPALCHFWRESGRVLPHAGPRHALWLVQRRADCLDEIGRREPERLDRWLAGDPGLRDFLDGASGLPRRDAD